MNDKNEEIEDLRDLVKEIGNELVTSKDEIKSLKNSQKSIDNEDSTTKEDTNTQINDWELKYNSQLKENKELKEELDVATKESKEKEKNARNQKIN